MLNCPFTIVPYQLPKVKPRSLETTQRDARGDFLKRYLVQTSKKKTKIQDVSCLVTITISYIRKY